jgi:phenylacetate-CoA ligase
MSVALKIYHRLPVSSRSLVASMRGYYLRWWRYDKETEKLVEQSLERDSWSKEQWADWQSERLSYILERAATRVPYYRRLWEEKRRQGDNSSWLRLENWPILEKKALRENSRDFVADDCLISKMFHDHTSGTTGTSLDLWFSFQSVKQWYALLEARARRWHGLSRNDRWAILGGQLVTPVEQQNPPFWVWNAGLNQLYLSSYHLAPDLVASYLQALVQYKIKYILGYSSAIYTLAQEALRLGRKDIKLDIVITNAEPLFDYQRKAITEAFNCPVRETYGMSEAVAAASECEHGSLHQWPDTGIIETEYSNVMSDFLCTGLINADMPLIRYRVGDSGKLSDRKCHCGRNLPLIEKIEGRSDDLLYTENGRRIGRLDPIFKNNLPIVEAQIIQRSLKQINIKYVPATDFTDTALDDLAHRIRERMGQIEVNFEKVDAVPRTNRGKFRAVICELPPHERATLEALT